MTQDKDDTFSGKPEDADALRKGADHSIGGRLGTEAARYPEKTTEEQERDTRDTASDHKRA